MKIELDGEQMQDVTIAELKELRLIIRDDPAWADKKSTKKDLKAVDRVLDIYGASGLDNRPPTVELSVAYGSDEGPVLEGDDE